MTSVYLGEFDVIADKTKMLSATKFPVIRMTYRVGVRDMFTRKIYCMWFVRNILVAHWMFSYMKPSLRVMVRTFLKTLRNFHTISSVPWKSSGIHIFFM